MKQIVNPKALSGFLLIASLLMGAGLTDAWAFSFKREKSAPSPTPVSQTEEEPKKEVSVTKAAEVAKLCGEMQKEITKLGWKLDPCKGIEWKVGGHSVNGKPLLYAEFGNPRSENTTLILSMVHGDEVTPFYLALQLANWIIENPQHLENARVLVAPLVNPDSFFISPRTRTNARGVDVNRNFPTRDWKASAHKEWKRRFASNPRRYPGPEASSEPETQFQEWLIKRARPQKILSIHAPLNFMDYDGPNHLALDKFPRNYVQECTKLKKRLKAVSGGFFPGSLGNYAGQEMGVPTLTLELPSADPAKADAYWKRFRSGIQTMITFVMPDYA